MYLKVLYKSKKYFFAIKITTLNWFPLYGYQCCQLCSRRPTRQDGSVPYYVSCIRSIVIHTSHFSVLDEIRIILKGIFIFLRPWALFFHLLLSKWMVVSSIFCIRSSQEWGITKDTDFFPPSGLVSMHFNWTYFKHKNTSTKSDFTLL